MLTALLATPYFLAISACLLGQQATLESYKG
jgi:hypothetical protein